MESLLPLHGHTNVLLIETLDGANLGESLYFEE